MELPLHLLFRETISFEERHLEKLCLLLWGMGLEYIFLQCVWSCPETEQTGDSASKVMTGTALVWLKPFQLFVLQLVLSYNMFSLLFLWWYSIAEQ